MSESNAPAGAGPAVVGKALQLLHSGLNAFVKQELKLRLGDDWERIARAGLPQPPAPPPAQPAEPPAVENAEGVERVEGVDGAAAAAGAAESAEVVGEEAVVEVAALDVANLLQIIEQHWTTVFVAKLGPNDRAAVLELRGVRNQFVHNRPFSTPEAIRALDRMQRLLKATGRLKEAQKVTDLITKIIPDPATVVPTKAAGSKRASSTSSTAGASAARRKAPTTTAARSVTWAKELDPLATAFVSTIGPNYRLVGTAAQGHLGLHDGEAGVQWSASVDLATGQAVLSVNLEGMQYDGWPIARLIERELASPEFMALVAGHSAAAQITLHWWRDCWQAAGRLKIVENDIAPTPITLDKLTPELWAQALNEAYACMDASRGHRGRARQMVRTAASGEPAEKDVSPHLGITTPVTPITPHGDTSPASAGAWAAAVEAAHARLGAFHDWATERAAR